MHVLKYLKSAQSLCIVMPSTSSIQIKSFCDRVCATCPNIRRSVTCFLHFYRKLSYHGDKKSKPQFLEVHMKLNRAKTSTNDEIQWLTYLLHDLKLT